VDAPEILVLSVVNFACVAIVGVVVDTRARDRDVSLRGYVMRMTSRVDAQVLRVDAALKALREAREGDAPRSSSAPPTLQ
jgi:hypothetical protein